jgi:hypothetical protein
MLFIQDFSPRTVAVNGLRCAIGFQANISASVPLLPEAITAAASLPTFLQTGYVSISGNRLVGVDGNLLTLNGANWFGFETGVRPLTQSLQLTWEVLFATLPAFINNFNFHCVQIILPYARPPCQKRQWVHVPPPPPLPLPLHSSPPGQPWS